MSAGKIREIRFTNTLSGKKELFTPRVPGKVSFYSCGPTVYNLIHIGNLRGGVVADMVFRYLTRIGYEVNYVRNYTDVDDKILKRALDEKITADEVTKKYIREVELDYSVAGMVEPTQKPCVTTHIPEIITLIERIIQQKKAYVSKDGEVFFSIGDFPEYGKLSHKKVEDLQAGMRVEVNEQKRNPLDFTLWKPAKPGEQLSWDSPWGKGRPGWHIECSAMSSKHLGDQIDLHHGGMDLTFPHHENEIAQSEAASGQAPFVKIWLHHGMLNFGNEKMSKSLGNTFQARDFLKAYGGEVTRYFLLSLHYRAPIDFNDQSIENTLTSLQRIYEAKAKAIEITKTKKAMPDLRAENLWGEFAAETQKTKTEIDEAFANDLNSAGALGSVFNLVRAFNRTLSEPMAQATPSAILGAQALIEILEKDIGEVLGIGKLSPEKALADLASIRSQRLTKSGVDRPTDDEIRAAIQARADARKAKNFAEADRVRKDLEARGVVLKDGPGGTTWEFK